MHKSDLLSGCFWFLFAAVFGVYAYYMGLGTVHKPGPGFLFFWISIILAIMSVITVIRALRQGGARQRLAFLQEKINWKKVIMVVVACFLYVFLLEIIGFVPMTFFLFVFILGLVEKRTWRQTILTSLIVTVCSYLLFETWLQARLPVGLLTFLKS